jgi:thioredoxin reductase (NADPH)
MKERKELNYDILILGGGPAGLTAAIYAARGTYKTAIIDTGILGGQVNNTLEIENFPGYPIIGGFDLIEKFEEHADKFKVDKYILQEITNITLSGEMKVIETLEYVIKAKAIIIATGAQPQKLNVSGETELAGRGVSYCAVCDGAFFRDKAVTVVGGGNAAIEEAIYLTKFASCVNVVHRRDSLRADKLYQERAFSNPKIKFIWDSVVKEIKGQEKVESIVLENLKTGIIEEINTDGVFPYVGFAPNSEMFAGQLKMDNKGFIITNTDLSTNFEGVFAAGDIRVTPLRQVIVAAADGAIAATYAIRHLDEVKTVSA